MSSGGRAASPPVRAKVAVGEDAKADKGKPDDKNPQEHEEREFGGAFGTAFIMLSSHIFVFCFFSSLYGTSLETYYPTKTSVTWFLTYHVSQWIFASIMPGVEVKGQTGLGYLCNGYLTFYTTIAICLLCHNIGVFDLTTLVVQTPAFLTTAVILGDLYSVIVHCIYARGGSFLSCYDFFMGTGLHPRIGKVDIKMVAETRISWTLLFLITIGGYIQTQRMTGSWLNPTLFMVLAHGIYGNACAKGEHFIPYTWDITTEKFGWMLCWWNLAGVPLTYCYNSCFLAKHAASGLSLPCPAWIYYPVISIALLLAYWVWDEANYHKCYFKMERRGELIKRNLFPTFRHIENPKTIKDDFGRELLIDGWYSWARKIHYTADLTMALLWGLSCGFSSFLPYVYFGFFLTMITHRCSRDEAKCKAKYGETWTKYEKAVPSRFIPGVF